VTSVVAPATGAHQVVLAGAILPPSVSVPAPAEPPRWWVVSREQLANELSELAGYAVRVRTMTGPDLVRLAWAIRVKTAAVQLLSARVASDLTGGGRPW
jgi:hypothetical protein